MQRTQQLNVREGIGELVQRVGHESQTLMRGTDILTACMLLVWQAIDSIVSRRKLAVSAGHHLTCHCRKINQYRVESGRQ